MGGDGQTFTNKRKLLEASRIFSNVSGDADGARRAHVNDKESMRERFTHCAMSLEPLEAPVVVDMQGNVLSKRNVVDYLIEQKQNGTSDETGEGASAFSHIRRLRDVCELQCGTNSAGEVSIECAMTGSVASYGAHRFAAIWRCGHVFTQAWLTKNVVPLRDASEGRQPALLGVDKSTRHSDGSSVQGKALLVRCPICAPPTDLLDAHDSAQEKSENGGGSAVVSEGAKGKNSKKSTDVGVVVRLLPMSLAEATEQGESVMEALKSLQQIPLGEKEGKSATGIKPPQKRLRETMES